MVFFTRLIREFAPGSILGGGALRDLANGRPVKDLDVFVPAGTDWDQLQRIIMPYYPFMGIDVTENYLPSDATITRATEFKPLKRYRLPLNVIAVTHGLDPIDRLAQFDFGLCQLAYDGSTITGTKAYFTDVMNQTLTLLRAENQDQFDRSMRRYERLSQKYQGWDLVIPEAFQKFKKVA